jgi:hypothetical protein
VHALFQGFVDGTPEIKNEIAHLSSKKEKAVPTFTAGESKFGLPIRIAQALLSPSLVNKLLSAGKSHDRLIQLNPKGSKLVWIKPGDEQTKKGFGASRCGANFFFICDIVPVFI